MMDRRVLVGGMNAGTGLPLSEAELHLLQRQLDEGAAAPAPSGTSPTEKRLPFRERVEHTTLKDWFDWYRHHGAELRGASNVALGEHYRREIDSCFMPHVTAEQRASFVHELGFARDWAESGFPQVVVSDGLFASFAATRLPAADAPELGLPWDCFVIRIPERFRTEVTMDYVSPDGARSPMKVRLGYIRVRPNFAPHAHDRRDLGRSYAKGDREGWELRFVPDVLPFGAFSTAFVTMSELLAESDGPATYVDWERFEQREVEVARDEDREEEAKRVHRVLRRVFVGAVLELMSPKNHGGSSGASKRKRQSASPTVGTIVLRRDVVVDCRDWLENHLRGDADAKRVITVQTLVRGHWRRQSHGLGAAMRKYVHIEPYWRGPEDAPIAVRSHRLSSQRTDPS